MLTEDYTPLCFSPFPPLSEFFPLLINADLMTPHRLENQSKYVRHLKLMQLVPLLCL